MDNYIKFQHIRTEGVKTIKYNKNIDSSSLKIAPLLLITIIENAFKHSTLNSLISILIKEENQQLTCVCSNDFDNNKTTSTDLKIGLQNLEKRLKLLYPDSHELTFEKSTQFVVTLKLDLK